MDAEDLGRKLLLTPSGDPRRTPEKQTAGTVTASHKILTLQALSSSRSASTAKRGCLSREKAFGSPPAVCAPERQRPFAPYRHLWTVTVCCRRHTENRRSIPTRDPPSTMVIHQGAVCELSACIRVARCPAAKTPFEGFLVKFDLNFEVSYRESLHGGSQMGA